MDVLPLWKTLTLIDMKLYSLFSSLLFCFPFFLEAQKHAFTNDSFESHPLDVVESTRLTSLNGEKEFATEQELINSVSTFLSDDTEHSLTKFYERNSPGGKHFAFSRIWKDRKIFRGEIKCNLNKSDELLSIYYIDFGLIEVDEERINPISKPSLLDLAVPIEQKDIWFPVDEGLVKAKLLTFRDAAAHINAELIVSDDEQHVYYYNDLYIYHHSTNPTDTSIQVSVFNPDPLTTAQTTYGGLFTDQNDADIGALNNQRVTLSTRATFDNGSFYLENDYVKMEDFESPNSTPPVQGSPVFSFTRAEQGFEYVNVFYHLTNYQEYMQSLGFNLVTQQISADPHAFFGQDNSYFSAGIGLGFGEGGVDDAEDADVIIHEYGHAISYDASPFSNNGTERRTLDEAIGDYLAASYSHSINPFNWQDVYTWDGHNVFWPGREVVTNKNYQSISFFGSIYAHTDLWSACIMDIYFSEGRAVADRVFLQSLYSLSSNMTFEQAALDFLQADTLLFGGQHAMNMYNVFHNRGILDIPNIGISELNQSEIQVLNSLGFANGGVLTIILEEDVEEYFLIDIQGRVVRNERTDSKVIELSSEGISSGLYFLQIRDAKGQSITIRLSRF